MFGIGYIFIYMSGPWVCDSGLRSLVLQASCARLEFATSEFKENTQAPRPETQNPDLWVNFWVVFCGLNFARHFHGINI